MLGVSRRLAPPHVSAFRSLRRPRPLRRGAPRGARGAAGNPVPSASHAPKGPWAPPCARLTCSSSSPASRCRWRGGGDHVRRTNRLTSPLKHSCPHGLHWCQDKDPHIVCDFLSRWPPRNAAQRARRSTLAPFCRAHHGRSANVMAQRRHALKPAIPLTTAAGGSAPQAWLVQPLVTPLRGTLEASETFANAIAQCAPPPPDCPLLQALPGAGPVFGPRRRAACGAQRARSASAAARPP